MPRTREVGTCLSGKVIGLGRCLDQVGQETLLAPEIPTDGVSFPHLWILPPWMIWGGTSFPPTQLYRRNIATRTMAPIPWTSCSGAASQAKENSR